MISQTSAADPILNKIVLIDKGSTAPYSGVLIQKHDLILLEKDSDLKDLFEQQLFECTMHCIPTIPDPQPGITNGAYLIAGGFFAGVISMLLLGKH